MCVNFVFVQLRYCCLLSLYIYIYMVYYGCSLLAEVKQHPCQIYLTLFRPKLCPMSIGRTINLLYQLITKVHYYHTPLTLTIIRLRWQSTAYSDKLCYCSNSIFLIFAFQGISLGNCKVQYDCPTQTELDISLLKIQELFTLCSNE